MTVSQDRTIAIGGIVIGLIGTGIVVLWPNKRWLGGVLVALGVIIALAAFVVWAATRSKRTDPNEAKLQELQRKLAELQSLSPELRLQVDNGSDTCVVPRPVEPPPEPSWVDIERFKEKYPELWQPPLNPRNFMNAFRELAILRLSDYQIESYNTKLKEFFRRYEDYVNRRYRIDEFKSRSICLDLELKNSGSCSATDVSVLLKLPTSLTIACDPELFAYPKAPSPPKKPQPGETLHVSDLVVRPHMPMLNPNAFVRSKPDEIRWMGTREQSGQSVASFEIDKLKHGFAKPFPKPLIVTFKDRDSINSFSIGFEIHAANLPAKQTGRLHVNLSD